MTHEHIYLDDEQDASWRNKPFNITLVTGESGTGKSVIIKILSCETWYNPQSKQFRRIVIFDLKGDYVNNSGMYEYGIRNSNRPEQFTCFNCHVIRYWKPHITNVSRPDFLALGMTAKGASFMYNLIKQYKKIHKNNISNIIKLLKDYPRTHKELILYNKTAEFKIERHRDSQVVDAVIEVLESNKSIFSSKKNYNLKQEVLNNNIIFIPPKLLKVNKRLMRFYYGIIVRLIEDALYEQHAMIIVEEADWLMPNPFMIEEEEKKNPSPIVEWFNSLLNKSGRINEISVILITQREGLLNPLVGGDEAIHYLISARVRDDKELSKLEFDYDSGIREFIIIDKMRNTAVKFIPKKPGCEV